MQRKWLFIIILAFITSSLLFYCQEKSVRESIIFFPIDETINFDKASTSLQFIGSKDDDEHIFEWDVTSITNKEIFLRQDISLLFSDGKLIDRLTEWEDRSQKLAQYKKVNGEDSSHYQAISLHYGEIHLDNDQIRSTQKMTSDHLYVIDSEFTTLFSFEKALSEEEKEWQDILDKVTMQHLEYSWNQLIDFYHIDISKYETYSLMDLATFDTENFSGLTKINTKEVVGSLWESLYKNYFSGLKTKEGKVIEPIGSTMPLILVAKDYSHHIILVHAEDGTSFMFKQDLTLSN